VIQFIQIFR